MINTLDTYHPLSSSSLRMRTTKNVVKKDTQHLLIILWMLFSSFCISETK